MQPVSGSLEGLQLPHRQSTREHGGVIALIYSVAETWVVYMLNKEGILSKA